MSGDDAALMARIEALLVEALALSDRVDKSLLGAKIDEALECSRQIAKDFSSG